MRARAGTNDDEGQVVTSMDDIEATAYAEWREESERARLAYEQFAAKWPMYRKHVASALLAQAIVMCDRADFDVQAFLNGVRATFAKVQKIDEPEKN